MTHISRPFCLTKPNERMDRLAHTYLIAVMQPRFNGTLYTGLLHLIGLKLNRTPKDNAESLINEIV